MRDQTPTLTQYTELIVLALEKLSASPAQAGGSCLELASEKGQLSGSRAALPTMKGHGVARAFSLCLWRRGGAPAERIMTRVLLDYSAPPRRVGCWANVPIRVQFEDQRGKTVIGGVISASQHLIQNSLRAEAVADSNWLTPSGSCWSFSSPLGPPIFGSDAGPSRDRRRKLYCQELRFCCRPLNILINTDSKKIISQVWLLPQPSADYCSYRPRPQPQPWDSRINPALLKLLKSNHKLITG